MGNDNYIRCQSCGCVMGIKMQLGWQEDHPVVVTCGKCGAPLKGKVHIAPANTGFTFEFENADVLQEATADYIVECSGEFPTKKKSTAADGEQDPGVTFINTKNCMNGEGYYDQFGDALTQLKNTETKWSIYKNIFELFQNKSGQLVSEIQKEFKGEHFQCRNEHETLRAVHMVELLGFYTSIRKDILRNMPFSNGILMLNSKQMKGFIDYLNSHDGYHLDELQAVLYKIYDEFMEVYKQLIPALVLQYCKSDAFDFEVDGSSTSTFDTVKKLYVDLYEALGTLMIIPIGLNNIQYRSDFNAMNPVDAKVSTLDDFIGLDKASRYQFCLTGEAYSGFLDVKVNTELINAMSDNDVAYDTVEQKITYNKADNGEASEYLLEFESEEISMFQGALGISEYLYRLREAYIMFGGL